MSNLTKYLTLMSRYSATADVGLQMEPQRCAFQSVEDYLKQQAMGIAEDGNEGEDWLSKEDRQLAIATDHLVEVMWHRNCVGFYILYASSLEAMEENIRQLLIDVKAIAG